MYTKDKNHRITLRLNEEQFEFVSESAKILDVSPSDFLRMVINSSLVLSKSNKSMDIARTALKETLLTQEEKEGTGRENDNANSDD